MTPPATGKGGCYTCAHDKTRHYGNVGRCLMTGCGCKQWRVALPPEPYAPPTLVDNQDLWRSLEPVLRRIEARLEAIEERLRVNQHGR